MKTKFTEKDKEKFLEKIMENPEMQFKALMMGLIVILEQKKLINTTDLELAKEAGKALMLSKWEVELENDPKALDTALFMDQIFGKKGSNT